MIRFLTFFVFSLIVFVSCSQASMPKPDCDGFPYVVSWCEDSVIAVQNNVEFTGQYSSRFGLNDGNNNTVLPCIFESVSLERSIQDSCNLQLNRVILRQNDQEYALNLKTNQQTRLFKRMGFSNGWLFGIDSLGWVVFDDEMNQVGKYHSGVPSPLSIDFMFYPTWLDNEREWLIREEEIAEMRTKYGFSQNPDIFGFGIRKSNEYSQFHQGWSDLEFLGLVNVATDQCTKAIYSQISAFYFENELFYWAVKIENIESVHNPNHYYDLSSGFVDIYSGGLQKVASYQFDKTKNLIQALHNKSEIQIYGLDNYTDPLIVLRDINGKLGAIDARGELNIPFIYDSIQWNALPKGENQYYLWKAGKKSEMYTTGNRLYCGWYSNTPAKHPDQLIIQYYSSSNFLNLADIDGQIVVDSCTIIEKREGFREWEIKNLKPKEHLLSFSSPYFWIQKDSNIYIYLNRQLLTADSTNFTFDSPYKFIEGWMITSNGKLFLAWPSLQTIYLGNTYFLSGKRKNTTYLLTIDGKNLREFENCKDIRTKNRKTALIQFEDGTEREFDLEKWDWKE